MLIYNVTINNLLPLPRLREIEEQLHGLKASSVTQTPALKFKVRNSDRSALFKQLNVYGAHAGLIVSRC